MTGLSKAQHEIRRPRCPASSVPGFLGFSPYASPMEEWEVHMGYREFSGNQDLVDTGNDMEDGIARGLARDLKWGQMTRSDTLIHPDDWACATPDRLFPQHQRGLQIKNHGPHMTRTYRGRPGEKGEWDNNFVPQHYLIQCLFEMMVVRGALGWAPGRWCLGAYFGGNNRRPYQIRWDPVLAKSIWTAAHLFWRSHIDPNRSQSPPYRKRWLVGPEKISWHPRKLPDDELLSAPIPTFSKEKTE